MFFIYTPIIFIWIATYFIFESLTGDAKLPLPPVLTFVFIYSVAAVLPSITPPGERDTLAADSTLPLECPALLCNKRTVLVETYQNACLNPIPYMGASY